MRLEVIVEVNLGSARRIPKTITKNFTVNAPTISEAFAHIPMYAANLGVALINDGTPVNYTVRVIQEEDNA